MSTARCRSEIHSAWCRSGLQPIDRQLTTSDKSRLWVADLTYVRTRSGFVYVSFIT